MAAQFSFNSKHSIKASVGNGFKAPDFRQLYLNFNNAAAGYSVFGSDVVTKEIENLQAKLLVDDAAEGDAAHLVLLDNHGTILDRKLIVIGENREL